MSKTRSLKSILITDIDIENNSEHSVFVGNDKKQWNFESQRVEAGWRDVERRGASEQIIRLDT